MARKARLLFVAALLVFACLGNAVAQESEDGDGAVEDGDDYEDEERAFLIVRKYLDTKEIVQHSNVTVVIELYNAGKSAALDVRVVDSPWPAGDIEVVGGSPAGSFSKIASGSIVKLSYNVIVRRAPLYLETTPPARVTYHTDSEGQEQQVAESSRPTLLVFTHLQKYQRMALRAGEYITAGHVRTGRQWLQLALLFGAVTTLLGGNWVYSTVTDARKRHKHEKALKDLMKDE